MGKTLCLPLKKEWYEMIESGIKTEEYREITAYWIPRLLEYSGGSNIPRITANVLVGHPEILSLRLGQGVIDFKHYTHIKFSYGYTKRTMTFECKGITIGKGEKEIKAQQAVILESIECKTMTPAEAAYYKRGIGDGMKLCIDILTEEE